eukprot:TRINITY_DN3839_c0_g1_i1.p1 TRINITY_DN3839_c0_g1~~TRINITY_DN3839_c0_g1_i1.p1  ORF type:complete len:673 (-),score=228.15 TRINITY_DN3839_c0_g1_i1:183-2201(-)
MARVEATGGEPRWLACSFRTRLILVMAWTMCLALGYLVPLEWAGSPQYVYYDEIKLAGDQDRLGSAADGGARLAAAAPAGDAEVPPNGAASGKRGGDSDARAAARRKPPPSQASSQGADAAASRDDGVRPGPASELLQRYRKQLPACAFDQQQQQHVKKRSWPPVWPHPHRYGNGTATVVVDGRQLRFTAPDGTSADLDAAFERYRRLMLPHTYDGLQSHDAASVQPTEATVGVLSEIVVRVANLSGELQMETDEAYELVVPADGSAALIEAGTVYGAYHALETLSQLMRYDFDNDSYFIAHAPWCFYDRPRFVHREILVDSSRHYLPVPTLLRFIESLPYAKLNVLHWHIVDRQAFPFHSPRRPLLSQRGAWSAAERYSVGDVAHVVEFARRHGVRVIVELDMPGHADSWCKGYPEVCPSETCRTPLNPTVEATYELISDVLLDFTGGQRGAGPVSDNLLHLGGDEVGFPHCWNATPAVARWLTQRNMTTEDGLEYFLERTQEIARSFGRTVVCWEETWFDLRQRLHKDTIIQFWASGLIKTPVKYGYRVLWCRQGEWYLDHLSTSWQKMYRAEPCETVTAEQCGRYVLGGAGTMWGEHVDTGVLHTTVWPRMAAVAERLWSPRAVNDTLAAAGRLRIWRCLLEQRGVGSTELKAQHAMAAPSNPQSCLDT